MGTPDYVISKTSFIKFEQCSKAFFLYKNFPYLRDKLSVDKQLTFRRGNDVGVLAQQLFPGGIDVSKETSNTKQALAKTAELIKHKCPVIYEAAFVFNSVLIMVDILCLENNAYFAYEVKSSLRVSETYLKDAYLQYYVMKNSLQGFEDMFLVTLDGNYILGQELEVKKLFRRRSIKLKAEENLAYFEYQLGQAFEVLEKNTVPNVPIGTHCFKPYTCDYYGTCWKDQAKEDSIFSLPFVDKTRLFEWHEAGIKTISQLKDEMIEKPAFRIIKNAIEKNETYINAEAIRTFLNKLQFPFTTMDMEVWNAAIPKLEGTKPFEQVPFLVCFYDGLNHSDFFYDHLSDQRLELAVKLIEHTKNLHCVVLYDKTLEVNIIDQLITLFPSLQHDLDKLKSKFVDLFDVFLNLNYYHPAFKNNLSLKVISTVLLKEVNYPGIGSGLEAMSVYEQYRLAENEIEKQNLKQDLVEYCGMDCKATFALVEFLKKL